MSYGLRLVAATDATNKGVEAVPEHQAFRPPRRSPLSAATLAIGLLLVACTPSAPSAPAPAPAAPKPTEALKPAAAAPTAAPKPTAAPTPAAAQAKPAQEAVNLHRAAETLDKWRRYGDLLAQYQGRSFRPGELRALKLVAHIADSRRAAFERVRRGHDERYRFLGAQRALTEYVDETGQPFRRGRLPTLEESMAQGGWLVGEPAEVRDRLLELQETFELEALIVQLQFHAMEQSVILEQIDRFANQVVAHLTAPPATAAQRP